MSNEQTLTPELDPGPVPLGARIRNVLAVPGRLLGVLVVPDRLMPAVVRDRRSGAAILALMAAGLLMAFVVGSRIDTRGAVLQQEAQTQKQQGSAFEARSDREIEEQIAKDRSIAQLKLGLGAGLLSPTLVVLLAIGTFLLGRFVGGRPTFSGSLSAVANAALPGAVKSVVVAVMAWPQLALSKEDVEALGRVAELRLPPPIGGIDAFTVWSVLLLVFGFAAAAQVSRRKSLATIMVCFVLYQLLTVGLCAPAGGPQMMPAVGPR
jgi:hypothetical protein